MTTRPTRQLHELGQRLWLDDLTRTILDDDTLVRLIETDAITGLTSNPSTFQKALAGSSAYDAQVAVEARKGRNGTDLFLELALSDLRRAADLFRPIFDGSDGVDGWVSMELSPLLAYDAVASIDAAQKMRRRAERENLFVKIPGTREGVTAIEESIFRGVPINVTLLFSREHYLAAAEAYLRAIERRLAEGRDPIVASVASLFVSRWDVAANPRLPPTLHNRLGVAVARQTYRAYVELLDSPRWRRLEDQGARPQRLLWASTGTKDPAAPDTFYVSQLVAPETIDTVPLKTLEAFAEHGTAGALMPSNGGDVEEVLASIKAAGIDVGGLAETLQRDGVENFSKDWRGLIQNITDKAEKLARAA